MTINVSEALDSDTGIILTIERTSVGSYVQGIYVKGSVTTFKTIGSPQQASPKELQNLPEGERSKDVFKFITRKLLRTTNQLTGAIADKVLFKGNKYKIISLGDWDIFGHTISFGARDQ